jgi:hypothetical protein
MPPTPPNVANLPHDLADFTVSVTMAANVDDDRAAQLSSTLTERAAEWLLRNANAMLLYVTIELDEDEAEQVSIVIGPKPLMAETRDRLDADALSG